MHYTYTDHLGSILTVTNSSGTIEAEQSFDAWGRRRNVTTWALLAPTAATGLPVWLYRGYTGHEHLDQFGLINMNGRLYDPVLGRMLSPDNFVQDVGYTQSFNRFSYAWNNPLRYTDPDGNLVFWDNVIIGAFTGLYNVATNLGNLQGNPWRALGYFGVGFTAGFVGGYGGPAAAGAILSAGNAALGGQTWQQVAVAGGVGAATGLVTAGLGGQIAPMVDKVLPSIASPLLRRTAGNVLTGALVGGLLGGATSSLGEGGFWSGVGGGVLNGVGSGLASGMSQGIIEAGRWGVSPWTGKTLAKYDYATATFPSVNNPNVDGNTYSIPLADGGPGIVTKGGSGFWIQGTNKSTVNTMTKGRFALESVPGDATRNFNAIRTELNSIGQKYGCHTCGIKTANGVYIPDHQPSLKLNPNGPFELFPHCPGCSSLQGGQVNRVLNH